MGLGLKEKLTLQEAELSSESDIIQEGIEALHELVEQKEIEVADVSEKISKAG